MRINRLDHYNIRTTKPKQTLHFYSEVLGLKNAPERRPPSVNPGTWILVDDHPAIHINFIDPDTTGIDGADGQTENRTGPLDHIAFEASGYMEFESTFNRLGIAYRKFERPEIDLCQLFLHDPNGVKIEINIRGELA